MVKPGHKIKKAVFDLRFNSKTALLQENSSLGGFVKQDLMPVVDQVFSEHALQDHIICIDKLEIDLGRIHFNDYKRQMPSRLREELDRVLKSKIPNLRQNTGTQNGIVPLSKRNFELIERFLLTGSLPAALKLKDGWTLDRRLQTILKQAPFDFLRFLKINSQRPQVFQRLVRQFPESTVRQVIHLLAPTQSETAMKTVDDMLRHNRSRSPSRRQTAALTMLVWELLLTYLLQNPDIRFTAAQFVDWITSKSDIHEVPATDSLKKPLVEAAQGSLPSQNLAHGTARPPKTAISKQEMHRILRGYDLYEALRFYLQHGMMPWAPGVLAPDIGVSAIIDELAVSYPEKIRKLAKELQYEPDLCQSLAVKLTSAQMKQFVEALLMAGKPGNDQDPLTLIQSIREHEDRAADRRGYYAAILHCLVSRNPVDLKQIAAPKPESEKAVPEMIVFEPGRDPDQIRAYLTAMLKADKKTGVQDPKFPRLLDELATKYPRENREYIAWLAADKNRFNFFLKLTGPQQLKKSLARLAAFPNAEHTIEILEKIFRVDDPPNSSNRSAILHILTQIMVTTTFADTEAFVRSTVPWLAGFGTEPGSENHASEALETLLAKTKAVANEKMFLQLKGALVAFQQQGNLELKTPKTPAGGPSTDEPTTEDESALVEYLLGDPSSRPVSDTTARTLFKRMVLHRSETLYVALRSHLKSQVARQKMITLLSENWLIRVLACLRPDLQLPVQTYADIIADACHSIEIFHRPEKINTLKWEFVFTYLAQVGNGLFHPSEFIRRYIAFLAGNIRTMDKKAFTAVLSQNLIADIKPASSPAHSIVLQELGHLEEAAEDLKVEHPVMSREIEEGGIEEVVVLNAGMVIAAPYLSQLWNMLELIEEGQFIDFQAAERAVHLLQYMTDENTESPEYQLVLNKILCGVALNEPITGRIDIAAKEQKTVEGLIRGMIENWKTIGQTSVAGFRKSFFQRRGHLTLKDEAWHLNIEQRAFDMLLDSIPWGFATIKHSWMERVLHVKWR